MNIQDANKYLAEDRILCLEIYLKGYKLSYVPTARAKVDGCKTLS